MLVVARTFTCMEASTDAFQELLGNMNSREV